MANAGLAVAGPLELVPVSAFREALEVNVLGAFATVKALLPLLRASRGRVVLMGSVSGLVALPLMGPYAASKFALEALADALRVELLPFGVRVVLVEPGSVATPIWERSLRRAEGYLEPPPPGTEGVYGRYLEVARGSPSATPKGVFPRRGWRRRSSGPWRAQAPRPATWWRTPPGPGRPFFCGFSPPPCGTGSSPASSEPRERLPGLTP